MQFNLTLWKDVPDQLRTLISFKDGSVAVVHLKASGNRGVWSLVAARPAGFAFQSGRARVVLTHPATIHPGLSMVGYSVRSTYKQGKPDFALEGEKAGPSGSIIPIPDQLPWLPSETQSRRAC